MPPVTVMALVVGPMEPATKRGLAGVENSSAASRASCAARKFRSWASSARCVFGEDEGGAAEGVGFNDVGPGSEIGAMDVAR